MNTGVFLEKYFKLIERIQEIDDLYICEEFFEKIYEQFLGYMEGYCEFTIELLDDRDGTRGTIHRLIKRFDLPIKELVVQSQLISIFYRDDV